MSKIINSYMNGKLITIENTNFQVTPLFCDICEYPMKTMEDSFSYKKNKCCQHCFDVWGYNPDCSLVKGQDPKILSQTNKTIEEKWNEYIKERAIAAKTILKLR